MDLFGFFYSLLSGLLLPALILIGIYLLISRSSVGKRERYLREVIEELEKQKPSMTVEQLIAAYKKEMFDLSGGLVNMQEPKESLKTTIQQETVSEIAYAQPQEEPIPTPQHDDAPPPFTKETQAITIQWQNWYSDNSINLLLYIGAFLIVASASVFVGFSWAAISGLSKGLFLLLFTFGFFICGYFFYQNEKIRNAGVTFLAIAGILVPFNGIAWHNFYLGPLGIAAGYTWIVTSLFAFAYYMSLMYFLKSKFYGYLSAFTSLSCVLALVNLSHAHNELYILATIISSLFLLIAAAIFQGNERLSDDMLTPFSISAHIMMPISLFFGLIFAVGSGTLITYETAIALLLAALYYYLAFRFSKQEMFLSLAQLLVPIGLFIFGKAADIPTLLLFIILQCVSFGYLYIASTIRLKDANFSMISHLTLLIVSFLGILTISGEQTLFSYANTLLLGITCAYFMLGYFWQRDSTFLTIAAVLFETVSFFLGKSYGLKTTQTLLITQLISMGYAASYLIPEKKITETKQLFDISLYTTPLLAIGVVYISLGNLLVIEVIMAGALLTLYYAMLYYYLKIVWYLTLAQSLFFLCAYLFVSWQHVPNTYFYSILETIPVVYTACYLIWTKKKLRIERLHTGVLSLTGYALVFLLALGAHQPMTQIFIFALLPTLTSMIMWYISKNPLVIWYHLVFAYSSIWLLYFHVIPTTYDRELTSISLVALAVCYYSLAVLYKQSQEQVQQHFLSTCALTILLAWGIVIDLPRISLIPNLVSAVLLISFAIRCKNHAILYGANIVLALGWWNIARIVNLDIAWYPLYFSIWSVLLYAASSILSQESLQQIYRRSGILAQLLIVIFFGIIGLGDHGELFRNALVSSYMLTVLLAYDAYRFADTKLGYAASALGMVTYLWQMSYLSFEELLIYTIPLGIYFVVLAYLKRRAHDLETATVFDYVAFFFLIAPTLLQMTGARGAYYALFLAAEGIGIFALGVTMKQKPYIYIGIGALVVAVISQTYEFLFSLPRWIILAIAGISFLGTAIYLLLLRGDKK